jgi:hypothetical protein
VMGYCSIRIAGGIRGFRRSMRRSSVRWIMPERIHQPGPPEIPYRPRPPASRARRSILGGRPPRVEALFTAT